MIQSSREEAISAAEGEVAEINNRGIESQVAAILLGWGHEEGERMVTQAITETGLNMS